MTIHFVSDIKHYVSFNYIHHMQHVFQSSRSVCHGVLFMARAIQARTLSSTLTYERGSMFPNVNLRTFWQHQHVSISCSSSQHGDRTVFVQFSITSSGNHGMFTLHCTLYIHNLYNLLCNGTHSKFFIIFRSHHNN